MQFHLKNSSNRSIHELDSAEPRQFDEFFFSLQKSSKFVKLCLHSIFIAVNTLHFNELFMNKIVIHQNYRGRKIRESMFTLSYAVQMSFQFHEIFDKKSQNSN